MRLIYNTSPINGSGSNVNVNEWCVSFTFDPDAFMGLVLININRFMIILFG